MLIGGSEKTSRRDQVGRPPIGVRGRTELGDASALQRRGVAAEEERLGRLGGGVDDDALAAGEEAGQLVAQFLAKLVVEIGERLVEEDEVGVLDQRAGDRRPLLLTAGQLGRTPVAASASAGGARPVLPTLALISPAGIPATRSGEAMFS